MNELRRARLLRAAVGRTGPVEPDAADWATWVGLATAERVLPQLHQIACATDELDPSQLDQSRAIQLDVAATMVRLEQRLLTVDEVLSGAGIRFAVLKGTATAHLDHPDPALRQFGDLDLLVDPAQLPAARAALEGRGWHQAYRLPRHHEAYTHAITFSDGSLAELDLHQRIAHRALGRLVPTAELLAGLDTFELAGGTVPALSRNDRLLHAAIHAVASRGDYRRLSSGIDVLVLTELTASDAGRVLERAAGWGVAPLLREGIRRVHEEAQLPLPEPWSAALAHPAAGGDRLVTAAYLGVGRRPALEELAHLRVLPGWRDRWRYLSGYFVIGRDRASGGGQREGLVTRVRYLWSRARRSP